MKLTISKTVIDRLSKTQQSSSGKLYGITTEDTVIILGLEQNIFEQSFLSNSFPGQLKLCGLFQICDGDLQEFIDKNEGDSINNLVVISKGLEDKEISVGLWNNGNFEAASYDVSSDSNSQFVFVNLKGEFAIKCEASVASIQEQFENLRNCSSIIFNLIKSNIFLLSNNNVSSVTENSNIGDIYDANSGQPEEINKKKRQTISKPKILESLILRQITKNGRDHFGNKHAPLCILDKNPIKVINTSIQVDCIAMVDIETKVSELYDILAETLVQYIRLYENKFLYGFKVGQDLQYEVLHFYPKECGHFLTLIYPKNVIEETLKPGREFLHKALLLDQVTPIFRRANRYLLTINNKPNQVLINPHEGLKPTDNGGQIALVKGQYEYYHYCQDNADDNGWGCAYRSLQTLASWYKLQGYVDKNVPTFHDIQKCLVDIQDKPASFLGSRQWIGSTEVNFVLNTLLGIECKILYVSSGEEMGTKGPELMDHFLNHGSPIMIGGGVLAHTILGVDYNRQTGDLRFLILDPHYTGSEDLHTIQTKGWCGWKKVNFWDKTSYYNMCLPLVPRVI